MKKQSTRRGLLKVGGAGVLASLSGCSGFLEGKDSSSETSTETQTKTYSKDDPSRFAADDDGNNDLGANECYEVDAETGEVYTVNPQEDYEVTVETIAVNEGGSNGNAAIRVNDNLDSVEPGHEFSVNGTEYTVDGVLKTGGSESSEGIVQLEYGEDC